MRSSVSLPLSMAAPPVTVPAAPSAEARPAELLHRHLRNVWRTLRRLGVPIQAVDDATQEVFVIAARKLGQVEPGNEQYFLYAIALRVAANARRAHATQQKFFDMAAATTAVDGTPSADALLDQKRLRAMLDTVLETLPEDQRTVFVLVELEGWSGPEIAELLQVPIGTVASRLRRAREIFHEQAELVRSRQSSGGAP